MCAANRKIIWLDTEYSTNWDSRIMYMYVYKFIQNIRWWQLKWKIVLFFRMDCDPHILMVCDSTHRQRWLLNIYVRWNDIPLKWVAQCDQYMPL